MTTTKRTLDAMKKLQQENEQLKSALKPFGTMAKNYDGFDGNRVIEVPVSINELRKAAELAL